MKEMWESSESFTAHATIGAGYFILNKALEEIEEFQNSHSTIERMVDSATGYDSYLQVKRCDTVIKVVKEIIAAKKKIDAPIEKDVELLNKIKTLKRENESRNK